MADADLGEMGRPVDFSSSTTPADLENIRRSNWFSGDTHSRVSDPERRLSPPPFPSRLQLALPVHPQELAGSRPPSPLREGIEEEPRSAPIPEPESREQAPGNEIGEVVAQEGQGSGPTSELVDYDFRVTEFYHPVVTDVYYQEDDLDHRRRVMELFSQDRAAALAASEAPAVPPTAETLSQQGGEERGDPVEAPPGFTQEAEASRPVAGKAEVSQPIAELDMALRPSDGRADVP